MTLPQNKLSINGQSMYQQDYNALGATAARADDSALKHLVLNTGRVGRSGVQRGVAVVDAATPLITSGASGISCNAFTAWVGAQTADSPEGYADMRSALVPAGAFTFAVPATGAFKRIDMILAKYEPGLASAGVLRKVKDPATGIVSDQTVALTTADRVTFVYVQATSATIPTWPVDPAGGYYIPLALVYVDAWAGTGSFPAHRIEIVADVRTVSGVRPASTAFAHLGVAIGTTRNMGPNESYGKPKTSSIPSDMAGSVERLISLSGFATVTGQLVDDSIDWRNRVFSCQGELRNTTGHDRQPIMPWEQGYGTVLAASLPLLLGQLSLHTDTDEKISNLNVMGQSFVKAWDPAPNRYAAILWPVTNDLMFDATENTMSYLYVDDAGALRFTNNQPSFAGGWFVWLRATAQYNYPYPNS